MTPAAAPAPADHRLVCQPVRPARSVTSLEQDVREGLLAGPPRSLPPKYFYDARGSELFDRICDTAEYYPTRTEDALLQSCAREIIAAVRPQHILELGAGTSRKTRRLLDACALERCRSEYAPFDVCQEVLVDSGQGLIADYDWLTVNALVGDYHGGLEHLPPRAGRSLIVFLGGTIGNFAHDEAVQFLRDVRSHMGPDDRLLLGADRFKDPAILHAAYNDAAGITARFNLNLLEVLNRELEADFEPQAFAHHACFNPARRRIEMHLLSLRPQHVRLGRLGESFELAEGEAILTEISRKFTRAALTDLLAEAGFGVHKHFEAGQGWFSLVLAAPAPAPGVHAQ